jgi:MYXO-CTERM domain-containing protein
MWLFFLLPALAEPGPPSGVGPPPPKWLIEVEAGTEDPVAVAAAAIPGVVVEVATRGFVQVVIAHDAPGDPVAALHALPGALRGRAPRRPSTKGSFTEGYDAMFASDWHAAGLDGTGARIAVLDVGFEGAVDLLGTELPSRMDTWFYGDAVANGPHGTAVSEILHDIAPGAELTLYQFEDEGQFHLAVDQAIANGETILSASIGFDNVWHADGTSSFAAAVEAFTEAGGLWINAAGNEAGNYWVGQVTDADQDGWLEFDGTEFLPALGFGAVSVSMRWDEPFGRAGDDLDLFLSDRFGYLCGVSELVQDGDDDPYEEAWCGGYEGYVSAYDYSGRAVGRTVYVYARSGMHPEWSTPWQSLTLPADARSALAVGAVELGSFTAAYYSSQGPTDDGRRKPDIAAPTSVSTESYGPHGFSGTSSATPHVSGVAALLLGNDPTLSNTELRAILTESTVDLGSPGPDNTYGAGFLRLETLPEAAPPELEDTAVETPRTQPTVVACGCAATPGRTAPLGLALLIAFLTRRRQRAPALR